MIEVAERVAEKVRHTFSLISFTHTIFALPFALASMLIAANGLPEVKTILLILGCMVLARTSAMAFNRYVDAKIDGANPRTQDRHIPRGLLSKRYVLVLSLVSGALFIFVAYFLNSLSFLLSPVALFIVWFYSYTKRFTHFAQLFLGLALAISPIGAWIAVRGSLDWPPVILGAAVLFWVAGFDIFYSTGDHEFDRNNGIKSLVVKFGIANSLKIARSFHVLTALLLFAFAWFTPAPLIYLVGYALVIGLLIYENQLVKADDLSRVNKAFFTLNGWVGIIFLAGTASTLWFA